MIYIDCILLVKYPFSVNLDGRQDEVVAPKQDLFSVIAARYPVLRLLLDQICSGPCQTDDLRPYEKLWADAA